jgi:hypothetical protein
MQPLCRQLSMLCRRLTRYCFETGYGVSLKCHTSAVGDLKQQSYYADPVTEEQGMKTINSGKSRE